MIEKKTLVVAANYRHFVAFCQMNDLSPRKAIYVSDHFMLEGRCLCRDCVEIIYYETWRDHPLAMRIFDMIKSRQAMGHRGV